MRQREILCIDDDEQSLQVRKILLETFDFHVTTATDGREGLKFFGSHDVDAVVVDYQMPGMSGGDVARAVKQQRPEVPVLVLSALPWLPEEAPRDCIDSFVIKGGPTSKLVSEIEHIMQAAPQAAKERMRTARKIGAMSGIVVEKLCAMLPRPKPPQPAPKLVRAARTQ